MSIISFASISLYSVTCVQTVVIVLMTVQLSPHCYLQATLVNNDLGDLANEDADDFSLEIKNRIGIEKSDLATTITGAAKHPETTKWKQISEIISGTIPQTNSKAISKPIPDAISRQNSTAKKLVPHQEGSLRRPLTWYKKEPTKSNFLKRLLLSLPSINSISTSSLPGGHQDIIVQAVPESKAPFNKFKPSRTTRGPKSSTTEEYIPDADPNATPAPRGKPTKKSTLKPTTTTTVERDWNPRIRIGPTTRHTDGTICDAQDELSFCWDDGSCPWYQTCKTVNCVTNCYSRVGAEWSNVKHNNVGIYPHFEFVDFRPKSTPKPKPVKKRVSYNKKLKVQPKLTKKQKVSVSVKVKRM